MTGRIDVHAHLIPGVDDGCETLEESLACARLMVEAGYTHAFCTPHIWPQWPHNNIEEITRRVGEVQAELDRQGVVLKLLPGGELNLTARIFDIPADRIVTYGMKKKYCLFDLWVDRLPPYFEPGVKYLQALGFQPVLAHPERMTAVQMVPSLADQFSKMGLLLQGNLQCFSDPADAPTRRTAEKFLREGRYFMLGSDTHNPQTMQCRLEGLRIAEQIAGKAAVDQLTRVNPQVLIQP